MQQAMVDRESIMTRIKKPPIRVEACCMVTVRTGLSPNSPEFLKTAVMPVDQACKRAEIQKNVQVESNKWN